jgi:hypothetical protein
MSNREKRQRQKFTEIQPKDGDHVLHCGHLDTAPHHFLKASPPIVFDRPDNTSGEATWVVICDACFRRYGADAPIRGDAVWIGNEPIIQKKREVQ